MVNETRDRNQAVLYPRVKERLGFVRVAEASKGYQTQIRQVLSSPAFLLLKRFNKARHAMQRTLPSLLTTSQYFPSVASPFSGEDQHA